MPNLGLLVEVLDKETGVSVMEIYSVSLGSLIGVAPSLAVWITVIVLAIFILRRGGGRAERFLIAGASLKLVSNLLTIPTAAIVPLLIEKGATITYATSLALSYDIVRDVVSMAGIICLVWAFWIKFKGRTDKVEGEK